MMVLNNNDSRVVVAVTTVSRIGKTLRMHEKGMIIRSQTPAVERRMTIGVVE